MKVAPADGCYIYGLFFEGARWNHQTACLDEALPKQLTSQMPYVWLLPTDEKREYETD